MTAAEQAMANAEERARGRAEERERAPRLTDIGNAQRFARMHGAGLRYVKSWAKWLVYDGKRWKEDELGKESAAAKAVIAELYAEAAALADRAARAYNDDGSLTEDASRAGGLAKVLLEHARKSSKASAIDAMLKLARSEERIAATRDMFDRDGFAFNVLNGTLDLRTGILRSHRPDDMLTKLANAAHVPDAPAPQWDAFLARVLPDEEVRAFVQRFAGHCLTSDFSEQILLFFLGEGQNGKNVLLDVLLDIFGDYGLRAPPDLVLAKQSEAHPTEQASLEGKRLAVCSEIEKGRAWAESTIKRITGDRTITARHMREDFYTFKATHKLVVAANTKPTVRGTDKGIWRRIKLVPFPVIIPEQERIPNLDERLLDEERAGILAWAVRGCLAWQREGMRIPAAVDAATAEYRREQDVLGKWIEEECVLLPNAFTPTAHLYTRFAAWCQRAGHHPWSRDEMREGLIGQPGIEAERSNAARGFRGIGLVDPWRD